MEKYIKWGVVAIFALIVAAWVWSSVRPDPQIDEFQQEVDQLLEDRE